MRTLPNDVARCLAIHCHSKHQCLRWLQSKTQVSEWGLWYGNFDVEYDKELGKCPYFMEE